MSSELYKVRQPAVAPVDAPALGFSLQFDLGAGRVATTQTFLPNDCSLDDLDAMFDKMTAAGDRQRAKYKIEELERDLNKTQREQDQHKEDLDRLDADYAKAQAERRAEAQKFMGSIESFMDKAREDHVRRGGRTEFQLKGGDKSNVKNIENTVGKIKDEIAKAEAEHLVAHANSETTFKKRSEIIARLKDEIARCRDIVARKT